MESSSEREGLRVGGVIIIVVVVVIVVVFIETDHQKSIQAYHEFWKEYEEKMILACRVSLDVHVQLHVHVHV